MADIFDEVAEELRADRARALLLRYGWAFVAAAVLAVGAVGGWKIWTWYQHRRDLSAATVFLAAENEAAASNPAARAQAAASLARLAAHGPAGYRTLAAFQAAAIDAREGKLGQALGLWNSIAASGEVSGLIRGLATYQWVSHQIDSGDPAMLKARLEPLLGGPWRDLALEAEALIDLRHHDLAGAKKLLEDLSSGASTPPDLQARAQGLLSKIQR